MKHLLPIPALLLAAPAFAQVVDYDAPLSKWTPEYSMPADPIRTHDCPHERKPVWSGLFPGEVLYCNRSGGGGRSDNEREREQPETDPEPQEPQECRPERPRGRV